MKKTLTMLLSLLLSFALVFTFVACNPATGNGKDQEEDDKDPGGETAESTVENNLLIESAFGALLDAGTLHLSLEEFSFSLEESVPMDIPAAAVKLNADCYVRKTQAGYDFVGKIDLMASSDGTDAETQTDYTGNEFISAAVYYVDSELYTSTHSFEQYIVGDAGYASVQEYLSAPDQADAHIYTDIIEDYSSVDETIGNDVAVNGSRVAAEVKFRPANSLNALIGKLTQTVPVLEQLGFSTLEDFVSLFKRAGASLAKLDGGKTEIAEDGSKSVSARLDLVPVYNAAVTFLQENLENSVGTALDSLAGKGDKYIESVIDKLFPATGSSLTVKQFIAALEETFAELGVEISFKAIVDEVQTITGLTTQELADVLNPLLEGIYTLVPEEGETLYDMLINGPFKGLTVDSILALIPMGSGSATEPGVTEDTGSESSGETLTSAMINSMLKAYLYNPDMTISALLQSLEMPILEIVSMLDVQKGKVSFGFSFDDENKLTKMSIAADLAVYMKAEEAQEKTAMIVCCGSADLAIGYTVSDEQFALPADMAGIVWEYEGTITVNTRILLKDLLAEAGCMTQEEAEALPYIQYDEVDFYSVGSDGYIVKEQEVIDLFYVTDQNAYEVGFREGAEEYAYFLAIVDVDAGYYVVKIQAPAQQAA